VPGWRGLVDRFGEDRSLPPWVGPVFAFVTSSHPCSRSYGREIAGSLDALGQAVGRDRPVGGRAYSGGLPLALVSLLSR